MSSEIGRQRGYLVGVQADAETESTNLFPLIHEEGTRFNEKTQTLTKQGGFGRRERSLGTETLKKI